MGSVDKKFRVNFSEDGAALLRDRVSEKLKEFMGDYTDDVLVEYVIVLLRNGRDKEEARNELNVFLGDDSDSFVSWLWDHLATNLDMYVQPPETHADEVARTNPTLIEQTGGNESHQLDSEHENVKPDNSSRGRHKREWKGVARDVNQPPPLRSSVVDNIHLEEKTHGKASRARRSPSPQPPQEQKRSRHDEQQHVKQRDAVSQATSGAPRRLLQFAVRDAVRTLRPSGSVKEPSRKRLRSVVSASTEDTSLVDRPRRLQSIARVPNPMATVLKAVREAAEDVVKVKSSGSVFDRLGRDMDASLITEQVAEFRDHAVEDDEYEDFNEIQEQTHSNYPRRSKYCGRAGTTNMTGHEAGLTTGLMSDYEVYDDSSPVGHRVMDVSQTGTYLGSKGKDSLMSNYNVAKDQDQSVSAANTSRKIVNISVNVNTWRPPHYQESRDTVMDNLKSVQDNEADAGSFGAQLMKEISNPVSVSNGNVKPAGDIQQEPQKPPSSASGSYTAGRPLEDADSRTIFVSNVHFAATKDSLSRHFNKFGEVLKVVLVTDAATGQPTGSAYVEFMRKEAADNALSLDGTSFMSRIVKVMKRSSSNQEASPVMTWPRISRGSSYAAGRFARTPFPRGTPIFRPRLYVKPGARSLQWKRDAQGSPAESSAAFSGSSVVSPSARSLTYVRTEPKPDGNSGTT
ncbi:hypothetical protein POPTR_001G269200v4 [Populus trichocarpa]|uniref:RRM domain-containing protein n=1 Tax=Populus trichocarpa TaxID=3694 RepID=A0A2K2C4B4_POPTR|nr:uncharacterized protein LOC7480090 isoform X1 [Populus trichocarpa]KAI5603778.1 hypothetical protein BDE02_01G241800 [Populus trichocarpa]PNT56867.1 hypothetical protein POPTR_001G269200v4 [Populus trichocarpa]|eukprot:XP_024449446.1 uncharacterized protein LOC7480090 isoform X1 [Populus trichocarpa]